MNSRFSNFSPYNVNGWLSKTNKKGVPVARDALSF